MTRNDYFWPGEGDNFSLNLTLWENFVESVQPTGGLFDLDGVAKYRYERYNQCRVENPNM
jgi:hypothetical protein